ncbi:DUF1830 domain-containing protein [Fischerella thermalis CCMEE 5268]|mgnify:FL=1|uniref:DUF1830 domain-containing protein n=2 Tax=Fischerella thermalis TaxID=372787 RepID=A0A2N6KBK5_9CYAN|nr:MULTISPECIES: DUF1830 domain-containing protein [Fischerella]PMB21239.1 DUF1830 domain-containing protein [Fischerella thermalis CCMEE 5319]PMB41305.1 DUF1830 domain-containing protein [Fischerella thermalis CCMEE 5205]BCX06766.1 MAG: hypothetical protein KatS3mg066_0625 [Fischerella sp.]PLZ95919.1 DUF1830 domain-containing protein [Fischerella thermalis CCMEE 5268]PMB46233.1 DUF1830 domain-containing protein [Fischerella thermalis CCMEE 5330]
MAQILDPLPPEQSGKILCCYVNATSKIQVARISNIPNWYFERVVFPGQRLVFEAPVEAQLEIHTGMMASAILSDRIPCDRLALNEPSSYELEGSEQASDSINKKTMAQPINTRTEDTTKPLTIAGFVSVD